MGINNNNSYTKPSEPPFFSVVIPTKNRPELLRDAISSVLLQNYDDYELIVSDNFNDTQTYAVIAEFKNYSHLKYFRTNSELNMPDHWEWATLKATGKYILVLTDRSVLKQDALNKLSGVIKTSKNAAVYSWTCGFFDNKRNIIFDDSAPYQGDSEILKIIKSEDLARTFLESQQPFPFALPRGLNSCYRCDVAENIRKRFGRLFLPICPDFTSAFLLLSQIEEIYCLDQSLFLSQGLEISTGAKSSLSTGLTYIKMLGNIDCYSHVPIKAPIVANLISNDYLRIQKLAGGNLKKLDIDWTEYFVRNNDELLSKIDSPTIDGLTLRNLRMEYEKALSLFDINIQKDVRNKTKRLIFLMVKARLKKSFLGPLLINLKRWLKFIIKPDFKRRYKNVLEAAGYNSPVKVCMVVSYFHPIVGGVERQAKKLSRTLIDNGAKVVVLTRKTPGTRYFEVIDGIPVYRMPLLARSGLLAALSFIFFSFLWILRNRRNIDIIHCHQAYSPALIGVIGKVLFGKKVIVKMTTSGTMSEIRAVTEELSFTWMRKKLLRYVDMFVTVSPQIEREMLDRGFPPEKIALIPNGVFIPQASACDSEVKEKYRQMLHIGLSEKVALYVGRLGKGKGLDTLLRAWKIVVESHPNARLLLVGEGNAGIPGGGAWVSVEGDMRRLSSELKIDNSVDFLGGKDNVEDYLMASDVFVLPSESEGMSNALLEAMAAGLPVIVTKIIAHSDIIREGVNGIMVEPGDPAELARAIMALFRDEKLAQILGTTARNTATSRYSFDRIVQRYLELYSLIMTAHHEKGIL